MDRDPDLVNVPLRELKLRSGVLIAGIVRRDGEIVIPGGNDTIRAGDDVIVVTQDTALQELGWAPGGRDKRVTMNTRMIGFFAGADPDGGVGTAGPCRC